MSPAFADLVISASPIDSEGGATLDPQDEVAHASAATSLAYSGLLRFARSKGGYRETLPSLRWQPHAYVWPLSQALDAAIVVASLRQDDQSAAEVRRMLAALENYWDPASNPPGYASGVYRVPGMGKAKYYDDNAWIGLNLVEAARLLNDPALLDRAKLVFDFIASGWDSDPGHPFPGGVFWKQSGNRDRNTVSTAGAAVLALELFADTGDRAYLAHAKAMYSWVEQNLKAPNGLYWDHVDLDGAIDERQFSYNQGLMVGAATLLHRHTGRAKYLMDAQQLAVLTLDHMGQDDRWKRHSKAFNAIFFKNLLRLHATAPDKRFISELRNFVADIHPQIASDTGLLAHDDRLPILDQAAVVQVHGRLWQALHRQVQASAPGQDLD